MTAAATNTGLTGRRRQGYEMTEENGKNLNDVEEVLPKPLQGRVEAAAGEEETILPGALDQAPADDGKAAELASAPVNVMTPVQAFFKGLGGKLLAAALLVAVLVAGTLICSTLIKGNGGRQADAGIDAPSETAREASATLQHEQESFFENDPIVSPILSDMTESEEFETLSAIPDTAPSETDSQISMPTERIKHTGKCGPDLFWTLYSNGVLVIEGSGNMYDYECQGAPWNLWNESIQYVAFPDGLTSVGDYAFYECGSIPALAIPKGVTSIGKYAFGSCTSLESLTLSDGLIAIGEEAFNNCPQLLIVSIPKSVSSIGQKAFADCYNLSRFSVNPDNQVFSSDEHGVLFNKTQTTLIACPEGMTDSYEIPAGVTAICNNAFSDCIQLNSIVLPESLISIGNNAFRICSISSINLPEGLVSIGEGAFYGCDFLVSVTLPASLTELGAGAFSACRELSVFEVDPANTAFSADERGVLYNLDKTTLLACPTGPSGKYDIPASVTAIASHAFDCCANLTEITIPSDVRAIRDSAFIGCTSLRSIELPNGLTSIGHNAFEACIALTSIVLPEGLRSIPDEVFCDCENLRTVTIPASVTSIGAYAFASCDNLTIYGAAGSEAERYANENGIPFEAAP